MQGMWIFALPLVYTEILPVSKLLIFHKYFTIIIVLLIKRKMTVDTTYYSLYAHVSTMCINI